MDDENGDNQGLWWVLSAGGGAIIVILTLIGFAVLLGWVPMPFAR